jgi:hypothetical protein
MILFWGRLRLVSYSREAKSLLGLELVVDWMAVEDGKVGYRLDLDHRWTCTLTG